MLKAIGKESKFVNGLRVTDKETVDIVQMVLAGKVNKNLVNLLHNKGGKAIGLCGIDGGMIKAVKHREKDIGYVGDITDINIQPVLDVINSGYIPVISSVAGGDHAYNVNADLAASRIAAVLGAENLILMTDIVGLLRDKDDESTLIKELNVSEVPALKMQNIIKGGMIPKVDCCIDAIAHGVKKVIIMDGTVPHSILMEILTDEGAGTMVVKEKKK
jgi:acetylglutamate kinase